MSLTGFLVRQSLLKLKFGYLKSAATAAAAASTSQPMAEPQQDETAEATASNESPISGLSSLSPQRSPSLGVERHQMLPPLHRTCDILQLQNLNELPPIEHQNSNPMSATSFIVNLPDLAELEREHSLQNVINLIPPPPPPPGLVRSHVSNAIPPPPPPPPSSSIASTSRAVRIAQASSLPQLPEMHSSLMAAIRSAGGADHAGLRPTQSPRGSNHSQLPKSSCAADDLMNELHRKLNLRRQRVSGRATASGSCGNIEASLSSNVKRVESRPEVSTSRGHIEQMFSHLSTIMPQPTASALQVKTISNGTSNNENDEDWCD